MTVFAGGASLAAPKTYLDCISEALGAVEEGRTGDSIQSLKQAMVINANDPLAHVVLGVTLLSGGRTNDAKGEFAAALEIDNTCAEAVYGNGLVYLIKDDTTHAAEAFCRAQELKPDLDMQGTIQYTKFLAGGTYSASANERGDESLEAFRAMALMREAKYAEAGEIWAKLQKKAVRPGFGERIGCSMSFLKSAPVIETGYSISKPYKPPSAAKSALPVVRGTINLKADLSRAQDVKLVSFFVDGKLVGITNTEPFRYAWDTTLVPNGTHTVKVQGRGPLDDVVCEKSTEVVVQNKQASAPSAKVRGEDAALGWARLWDDLKLKPSAAAINYNLATCAMKQGDNETASAALERVLAANPTYLDAADKLSSIYHPSGEFRRFYKANTDRKVIALSFDDGPKKDTSKILDILKAKGVKATFFLVGKQVDTYPDTLKRMASEGHELENHTYNHRDLDYLSESDVIQEVFKTVATVRSVTGKQTHFLRPPGGHEGKKLPGVLRKFGMTAVYWSTNCSAVEGTNKKKFVNYVISTARPGGLILMHNLELVTVLALPDVIDALKAKGYSFVTLSELAR